MLDILADTMAGVTLEQITKLTREIGSILEFSDIMSDRYRLEVSSPGVDRPLTETWQFEKNIGRQLHVNVEIDAEPIAYEGQLLAVDDKVIYMQVNKNKLAIDRADIVKAKDQIKMVIHFGGFFKQ